MRDYFCKMNSATGKYIIVAGIILVVLGILIYFFHDKLHWIGRLPGDIKVEKENFRFYFPVTTMVLISLAITLLLYFIKRLL